MAITPNLQDLIAQVPGYAGQPLLTQPEQEARIQQILDATLPAALRRYGTTAQQIAESTNNRGMLNSSDNAYQQALNTLMQQEGTAQIANQARTQVEQAQRAALGQAAEIANAQQNRQAQTAYQQSAQRFQRGQANQRSIIGGLTALGQGVGGLVGKGLTGAYGNNSVMGGIVDKLKGYLGAGPGPTPPKPTLQELANQSPGGYEEGQLPPDQAPVSSPPTGGFSSFYGSPTGGSDFSSLYGDVPQFQMPQIDLSGLNDWANGLSGNFWDQEA